MGGYNAELLSNVAIIVESIKVAVVKKRLEETLAKLSDDEVVYRESEIQDFCHN